MSSETEEKGQRKTTGFPIIGPRASGKTTYLAALVFWPKAKPNSPIESVTSGTDETNELVDMAGDILQNRLNFAPTDPDRVPLYGFSIQLKSAFLRRNQPLEVYCRDFAGELFEKLYIKDTNAITSHLNEWSNAPGLLIMLDGSSPTSTQDDKYATGFENLKVELESRINKQERKSYRLAIVFSKAEQRQVWLYRNNIPKFMNNKFNATYKSLEQWSKEWQCPINYFFCSAFGMKIKIPDVPNRGNAEVTSREGGVTRGILDNPDDWQPFGLVAPIYWLHTGKDHPQLRDTKD